MKALITGGTGFIGSHLAEGLSGRGWQVRCLVRRPRGLGWLETLKVDLAMGDCRDKSSLGPAVEGVDYVFHLAGVINALSFEEYFETNVVGTKNLLEATVARNPGLKKFVHVSSISAAGPSPKGRALDEEDPCFPVTDYGRTKLASEEAVQSFARHFPHVIIRPPNVIGPRQRELREAVRLMRRRIRPAFRAAGPQTSLCYVGDVVEALILAAERPEADGRTYFLAFPKPYSWAEVTEEIRKTLGIRFFFLKIPYPVQWLAALVAEAAARLSRKNPRLTRRSVAAARKYDWIYDGARIRKELGFVPRTNLEESIRKTVAWNDANGWA
jgi:nucleoside-diphosphate-sugar epimerase